jgi:hypothetical protein
LTTIVVETVVEPVIAVILTVFELVTALVVTVAFEAVAPAGTVMLAGTCTAELLLDRVTTNPPVGAAPVR